jgi:hypothetical protein
MLFFSIFPQERRADSLRKVDFTCNLMILAAHTGLLSTRLDLA